MKVLHVNAGLEKGGGLSHIVNLLTEANRQDADFELLTLADGPVAKAAKKAGIKTTILGAQSRYDLTVLKRLAKFINNGNFDIVHTHGARANLFVSMIKKQIKAKWIITVHSDPLKDFEGRGMIGNIFTKLNIMALKKADGISKDDVIKEGKHTSGLVDKVIRYLVAQDAVIKYFDSESRTTKYIVKDNNWHPDEEHINQLTQLRHMELGDMNAYIASKQCYMQYVTALLNDKASKPCGHCAFCKSEQSLSED